MVNPVRGEARLDLPGRSFILVMDMEALIAAEAAYGKPMPQMMKDAKAGFVGATRAIFVGSLASYHPDVTKEEAMSLLQEHPGPIGKALNQAGEQAWPDAKKVTKSTEGKENENPPGKSSGGGGAKPGSTRKRSSAKRLEATE